MCFVITVSYMVSFDYKFFQPKISVYLMLGGSDWINTRRSGRLSCVRYCIVGGSCRRWYATNIFWRNITSNTSQSGILLCWLTESKQLYLMKLPSYVTLCSGQPGNINITLRAGLVWSEVINKLNKDHVGITIRTAGGNVGGELCPDRERSINKIENLGPGEGFCLCLSNRSKTEIICCKYCISLTAG